VSAPLKPDCLLDPAYMAAQIAGQSPVWEPGSRTAYHPLTGGFILAEIIRRCDGRDLGRFFGDEIATPLGLDFWIGLPEEQDHRAAPIISFRPPRDEPPGDFLLAARKLGSLQNLFLFNHGDWKAKRVNTPAGRQAAIGAASGTTNAAGLAGLYAALHEGGPLGFSRERLQGFGEVSSATHLDGMLLQPTRFGPGFMLRMDNRAHQRGDSLLVGTRAYGHVGAGGSVGFRDPDADLAFAYTMNRQGPGFLLNHRGQSLVDATYASLAG
jgi:CubicO group peptidase (beta-lactamase class C family)